MPFNLSGLINNLRGSFDNALNQFLGKSRSVGAYPESGLFNEIQNRVQTSNWYKLNFPYTFDVIDIKGGGTPFSEFQLPLAPQSISQSEEFATSIRSTQGGSVVTHSGNKYKTLLIEGTTGISPFRGTGGVDKTTGQGILQPKDLKYRSGYEVFLHLRNYFKTYYEYKKTQGRGAANERLVFKNYKDGEFLIIEVIKFDMNRQAARPHLYDYKIECKVLRHFKFETPGKDFLARLDENLNNAVAKIDLARGTFLRAQGVLRQIESTYTSAILEPLRKISLAVKAAKAIPVVAGDLGNRIIKNTVNEVSSAALLLGIKDQQKQNRIQGGVDARIADVALPNDITAAAQTRGADTIIDLGEALMAMPVEAFPEQSQDELAKEIKQVQTLPRSFFDDTITELRRIKANAEDSFNLSSDGYDDLFNRTSTLQADFAKIITDEELDVLNAFNDSISGIENVLATDLLFKSSFEDRVNNLVDSFSGQIELLALPTVQQYTVSRGDTLERIAQIYLQDSNRWLEIAEINDLKFPYISDDLSETRSNIVKPGDILLIPQDSRFGESDIPKSKITKVIANLNEVERNLGVDLKVTPDYDLAIGNSGDLEVVAGTDNMAQAVLLKIAYEKGEVMRAPEIGIGLRIGSKLSQSLDDIKDAMVETLLQDSRVDRVEDLAIIRSGPEIRIAFNLFIKQVDTPVPVSIRV